MEANTKWTRQGIRDLNYYGPKPAKAVAPSEDTTAPVAAPVAVVESPAVAEATLPAAET